MTKRQIVASGIRWNFIQTVSERLLQTIVFFVVARLVGADEFGFAAMAVAPATICTAVMHAGSQYIVQERNIGTGLVVAAFWFNATLGLVLSIAVAAVSFPLAWLLGHEVLTQLMLVAAISPLIAGLGVVSQGLLQRDFEFKALALRRTLGITVSGLGCIALALIGFGAWSMVAQLLLTNFIMAITALVIRRPALRANALSGLFTRVGKQTLMLTVSTALIQANIRLADVVVGYFAGPGAAGTFRLARTVLDLVTSLVFTPVSNILLPMFSRQADNVPRLLIIFARILSLFGALFSAVALCVIFGAEPFERLILGNNWPDLGTTLAMMGPIYPSIAISSLAATLFLALGENRLALLSNAGQFLSNMVAVALGAWLAGPAGAAALLTARAYIAAGLLLVMLHRLYPDLHGKIGMRLLGPFLVAWGFGGAIFMSVFFLTNHAETSALLLTSIAGLITALAIYGCLFWLLFRHVLRDAVTILPLSIRQRGIILAWLPR